MRTFCLFSTAACFVLMCSPPSAIAQSIKVKSAPTYQAKTVAQSNTKAAVPVAPSRTAAPRTAAPSANDYPGPPVTNYTKPDMAKKKYAAPVTNGTAPFRTKAAVPYGAGAGTSPSMGSSTRGPLPLPGPTGRPPAPLPPHSGVLPNKPLFAPGNATHNFKNVPATGGVFQPPMTGTPSSPQPALIPPADPSPNTAAPVPVNAPTADYGSVVPTVPGVQPLASDYFPSSEYIADQSGLYSPGQLRQGQQCPGGGCGPQPSWFGPRRPGTGFLRVNTPLSFYMLDFQNRQTDKEIRVLQDARGRWAGPSLTVGGQLRASVLYGATDTQDSFPYLGRFPADFEGNTVTDARLLNANTSMVLHAAPWAHAYFETLFSDVFSVPTFDQGSFQARQAYVVLGNLDEIPFYAFIGKKTVPFGSFGTLNPFTQAVPWNYFNALAEGAGIGYAANGLSAQVMGINGGPGIRVTDSEEFGHINNFAANVRYDWRVNNELEIGLGGGYLHGTIYDAAISNPIDPTVTGVRNGAWDVNGSIRMGSVRLNGELAQTENPWPVTGRRVTAWQAEAAYDFLYGKTPCVVSAGFSEGNQGDPGTQFETNRQLVIGLRMQPSPNAFFTFEYVRSTGFAPLTDIGASDRDVEQNSAVFGVVLAI